MKLKLLSADKTEMGTIELPAQFSEKIRPDIIRRAVLRLQSIRRQKYGASPEAGKRASAELSRRRHKYRGSYGSGISRVPRKILSRRGTRMNWVGAFAPGTVGGRRAHPPKAEKNLVLKINKKENRKAIRSAMSATVIKSLVEQRGHKVPEQYPFVVDAKLESITKTKEARAALTKLGFADELQRCEKRKIRAGKATMRNRRYKRKKGLLLVVGHECPLMQSANNIAGIDIVSVNKLNAEFLAPGADYGRITIYTKAAIERLAKEGLFTQEYKAPQQNDRIIVKTPAQKKEEKKPVEKKVVKKTAKKKVSP